MAVCLDNSLQAWIHQHTVGTDSTLEELAGEQVNRGMCGKMQTLTPTVD